MLFNRPRYLRRLIDGMHNGQVKVITGLRRCGKSFLLFKLFNDYLRGIGVPDERIIKVSLDQDVNAEYRNPDRLSGFLRGKLVNRETGYYVFLDEVQYAVSRDELRDHDRPLRLYGMLNGLLQLPNVDVYVTGSNSKMLSSDIRTEFRGRGDVIAMHPLGFGEYFDCAGKDKYDAFSDYVIYGGLPFVWSKKTENAKIDYLSGLFRDVYNRDILERYDIEHPNVLEELVCALCSSVGSLTNVTKMTDTVNSVKRRKINPKTIGTYLGYLTDSFLFRNVLRYDVKGRRYFEYPSKYYCEDVGLRNVMLNMRQIEPTRAVENIIFNELIARGCSVDVGVVPFTRTDASGNRHQERCEIDFVVNQGRRRLYIQSAFNMDDPEKRSREIRPFLAAPDGFQRIVVTNSPVKSWEDDKGIRYCNVQDFLLDEDIMR